MGDIADSVSDLEDKNISFALNTDFVSDLEQFFNLCKRFVESVSRFNRDCIAYSPDSALDLPIVYYTSNENLNPKKDLVYNMQLITSPFGSVEGNPAAGSLKFTRSNGTGTAPDNAEEEKEEEEN